MTAFRITVFLALIISSAWAGNPERAGQAGATQLLINPYARSSGMHGMDVATTSGIMSAINNPAGLTGTRRTEVVFSHTRWLVGSDISINALGFSQRVGRNGGVLGISVVSFDLGDIEVTTIDQPDGGLGYFSPTFLNLGLSYAKEMFRNRIFVGGTAKLIHESITDVAANGFAFDGGVQYRNADQRFRLGVSLRNIGPAMRYSGDGLAYRGNAGGSTYDNASSTVSDDFELPGQYYIGASYEFSFGGQVENRYITKKEIVTRKTEQMNDTDVVVFSVLDTIPVFEHKIIPMVTFVSNAFQRDQLGVGFEYRFRDMFMVRGAYMWEDGGLNQDATRNAYSGFAAGATFELPFSYKDENGKKAKTATTFAVDYSYRHTWFFAGTHSFGLRINL